MRFVKSLLVVVLMVMSVQRNALWGDVITLWADASAKSPHKARPRYGVIFGYFESGRWEEGLRFTRQAMVDIPNAPTELWQSAGNLLLKQKRFHEAQSVFGEAVQNSPAGISWQNMAASWYQEWLNGNKDPHLLWLAAEAYSRSLQYDYDNGWVVDGWADVYLYSGAYVTEGKYLFAVDRVLDGTEAYVLGKWMLNTGNPAGGAQLLHLACLTRDWVICHFYEGFAQQQAGRLNEAIAAYKETIRHDPQLREARYNLGLVYVKAGMDIEADASFRESGMAPPIPTAQVRLK